MARSTCLCLLSAGILLLASSAYAVNGDAGPESDATLAASSAQGNAEDGVDTERGSGPGPQDEIEPREAVGSLFPDGLLMLVLIVKDEASSIEDILRSAMPWCETYYILDTGSTDDTIPIIKRVMEELGKPGVLEEGPFVDFATTRNYALERSGTGTMYKLFIDGDWFLDGGEELRFYLGKNIEPYKQMMMESPTGCRPCLPCFENDPATDGMECGTPLCRACAPVWMQRIVLGTLDYYVPRVIRSNTIEKFAGVVHEVIGPHASPRLPRNTKIIVNATDTNREHSRQRWFRDEKLLEAELAKNPDTDTRSAFYLAQTYELIDKPEKALEMNLKRVEMGGWSQERYMSLSRAGENALAAGLGFEEAKKHWLRAYEMDPTRAETLFKIAWRYKQDGNMKMCAFYSIMACRNPYPAAQTLFIHGGTYDFERWDLLGICAWYVGEYQTGFDALLKALEARPNVQHTRENLEFYLGKADGVEEAMEQYPASELETETRDEL